MNVNLSIKDVPEALAQQLRERAARHHRSLQGELMAIIEQALAPLDLLAAHSAASATPGARAGRTSLAATALAQAVPHGTGFGVEQGWKTVEQLLAERQAQNWMPHASLAAAQSGLDITRADRDSS